MVLAGNLNYSFNKYLTVGAGIISLPGARSVEGNFPFWLSVDSRLIADEFIRPSYSSGIKASGTIAKGLIYQAMIANNRSTLGVSAAQLPNHFNTVSSVLIWMPTGDYGLGWGDFEHHESLVTRFGFHFTHSNENKQSQPNDDEFENIQLRISDGSVIFTPNLFGPGIMITDAVYKMASFDLGSSITATRLRESITGNVLSNFRGTNTSGLPPDYDYGYQLQASAMVLPKTLQIYAGGSEIIGQLWPPMGLSRRDKLLSVQEQSHSMEHRVSLPVQISCRLHIRSFSTGGHWTDLSFDSGTSVLRARRARSTDDVLNQRR